MIGWVAPGGSGFLPSTVSLMPPGLPSLMSTPCRNAHLFEGPVGAENHVTSCDLGIFVDQATEPVAPQHMDTRTFCG